MAKLKVASQSTYLDPRNQGDADILKHIYRSIEATIEQDADINSLEDFRTKLGRISEPAVGATVETDDARGLIKSFKFYLQDNPHRTVTAKYLQTHLAALGMEAIAPTPKVIAHACGFPLAVEPGKGSPASSRTAAPPPVAEEASWDDLGDGFGDVVFDEDMTEGSADGSTEGSADDTQGADSATTASTGTALDHELSTIQTLMATSPRTEPGLGAAAAPTPTPQPSSVRAQGPVQWPLRPASPRDLRPDSSAQYRSERIATDVTRQATAALSEGGEEFNGINLGGAALEAGALAAAAGVLVGRKVIAASANASQQRRSKRLLGWANELGDRLGELHGRLEDIFVSPAAQPVTRNAPEDNAQPEQAQGVIQHHDRALEAMDQRLTQRGQPDPHFRQQPLRLQPLDPKASVNDRLDALEAFLKRFEGKLDSLEARIEALEHPQQLQNPVAPATPQPPQREPPTRARRQPPDLVL